MRLAVNIDHIATLREARKAREPEPVAAALFAEMAGAQGITVHLRTDRRHIKERDVELLRQTIATKLNAIRRSTDGPQAILPYSYCGTMGLLQGEGKVVRHIVLEDESDLDMPAVRALMSAAIKLAKRQIDPKNENRIVIKSISKTQRPRRPVGEKVPGPIAKKPTRWPGRSPK